jgi:ABC-2 type transport system ATP-binding protein
MLEVRGLTKRFRHVRAIDDVSFTVRAGEVCGYLGPNGSGKSTTFKILTGLMAPSSGEVLYRGVSVSANPTEYKRLIGYVPEEPYLYPYLTGGEYLELVGRLREIPERRLDEKIIRVLKLLSLASDRHSPLSAYSKGMKQKILIAAALLHDPEIVLLDEPFSGLDVGSALMLKQLLGALAGAGKVVLYSSHVLEVVEKVCSRVIILHEGHIVADNSIADLRGLMRLPNLEEIFSQLAVDRDSSHVAAEMLEVMRL